MACRDCKHLTVGLTSNGRRVIRKDKVYQCAYEVPAVILPMLPASIVCGYGFKWPPPKSWMCGDDGKECSVFEKLK
jgi:hypothetical protein